MPWQESFYFRNLKKKDEQQDALFESAVIILLADYPKTVEQMQKERELIRLILDAGCNPNHPILFDDSVARKKIYAALEIAKTDGFVAPKKLNAIFADLADGLHFYSQWERSAHFKKQPDLTKLVMKDLKDLVYILYQKGMYPTNPKVFEKLAPVVLEKEPEFFNKRKEQVLSQMKRAKTPIQIYNAIMGRRKEKN
ncbi:MAG: hypothetical protein E7021_01400 [Alphaproteobacteria bacterium]|nr:hypothetical protein [Alphaproteobacteria bacterium]